MSNNIIGKIFKQYKGRGSLLGKLRFPRKGIIPAFVIYGAIVALLVVAGFFIALFQFYGSSEISVSDKIADGLSSINYFYMAEKNINEFMKIVTEITAKELGEACGGFDCYSWGADSPTYRDLRDKFEETLRGKITGFPKQIGSGGRIGFDPPIITGLEMDESRVKTILEAHQVYRRTGSFLVNASSEKQAEIDKQIRYLLLAKIGQKLYGNGTYARDSGKVWINSGRFDCNNDGVAEKSIATRTQLASRADLAGCKILEINFDVDDKDGSGSSRWNGYQAACRNIANSPDPGIFAGRIEGGNLFAQIDSLLEKSLVCGIGGTDGLASVTDTYGEVSKSGPSESMLTACSEREAGANAWKRADMQGKIQAIMNALESYLEAGESMVDVQVSAMIGSAGSYSASDSKSGWDVFCGNRQPGGCPSASCRPPEEQPTYDIPQYCKAGDACGRESSLKAEPEKGSTCSSPCSKNSRTLYVVKGESGYCCPKDYPVFDPYTKTCSSSSEKNLKIEVANRIPPGSKTACNDCTGWIYTPSGQPNEGNPGCIWSNEGGSEVCSWNSNYNCGYSGTQASGRTTASAAYSSSGSYDTCGFTSQTLSREQRWGGGVFSETKHEYYFRSRAGGRSKYHTYSCMLSAYFKFTFTPEITFRIVDTGGDPIVKKGTTDFESLYFAVKFRPDEPYVIGDTSGAGGTPSPTPEYTCAKISGQACETGQSCPSGKAPGTGTCEPGKSCCKPAAAASAEDLFITLSIPDSYGQPTAKTLKLTCKREILGSIQPTDVEAEYESADTANGLRLVKFKFTKEKLQQLKDAGCVW